MGLLLISSENPTVTTRFGDVRSTIGGAGDGGGQRRMGDYDFGGATYNLCHNKFLVSQLI